MLDQGAKVVEFLLGEVLVGRGDNSDWRGFRKIAGIQMKETLLVTSNCLWLALLFFWAAAAPFAKKIVRQEPILIWLTQMAAFVVAMVLLVFPPLPVGWLNESAFSVTLAESWVGASLVAVGIAFVAWARLVLGRNWSSSSAVKHGHELIRSGPYRWVRHPIYTGLGIAVIGSALLHGEVRSLIAVAICGVGFWSRIRAEEHLLIQEFQAEYLAYREEAPAFVPSLRLTKRAREVDAGPAQPNS